MTAVIILPGRYRRADIAKLAKIGRPVSNLDDAYDLMLAEAQSWGVPNRYAQDVTFRAWLRLHNRRS